MNEEKYGQIMLAIGEIKGKVDTGFSAITQRMDTANGRTEKLEGKVEKIQKGQATADGRVTAYSWVFGGAIALIGLIFTGVQLYLSYKK